MATDTAIYTLGLNAGQLGHLKGDKHIAVSKKQCFLYLQFGVIASMLFFSCQCSGRQ